MLEQPFLNTPIVVNFFLSSFFLFLFFFSIAVFSSLLFFFFFYIEAHRCKWNQRASLASRTGTARAEYA
jgi:hypothetical protein